MDPAQLPDRLTIDVLRGVARGRSNAEVASDCHVSERTLNRKLAEVRGLWGVDTTIEAVVVAARFDLL